VKVLGALICGCIGLTIPFGVVNAAKAPPHDNQANPSLQVAQQVQWQRRDTATYVVSTVNLLRTEQGQPLRKVVEYRMHVSRYAVFADDDVPGLYFIRLKQDTGSIAGTLAYRMGWPAPLSLCHKLSVLGITAAPPEIWRAYKTAHLTFLGAFSSSLPQ
jgi:hypothetical protein